MAGQNRRSAKLGESGFVLRTNGEVGGYDLPEGVLPKGEEWHPLTVRWWDHWRRSPQSALMATEVDWDFLLDTALIHHNMWKNGRWEFANEVRMRTAQFGATPAARRALKAEIEVVEEYPAGDSREGNVSDMNEARRKRLANGGA